MEIWNYGEVAIGVMDMEDDKVADMVLKFPYEDSSRGGAPSFGCGDILKQT